MYVCAVPNAKHCCCCCCTPKASYSSLRTGCDHDNRDPHEISLAPIVHVPTLMLLVNSMLVVRDNLLDRLLGRSTIGSAIRGCN